jgi:hypothetical protein
MIRFDYAIKFYIIYKKAMANHVYTNVHIKFATAENCNDFLEWINYTPNENTTYGEQIELSCNCMLDTLYPDKEESHAYFIDNIGAKWIFFDGIEYNETDVYIDWTSAWSATDKLIDRLGDFLIDRYPGVELRVTYEDEGFAFVGAIFTNSRNSDSIEYVPGSDELENSEYQDEDNCLSDKFFDDMIVKKQELLDACIDNVNNSDI